jgi:hypothetical protein
MVHEDDMVSSQKDKRSCKQLSFTVGPIVQLKIASDVHPLSTMRISLSLGCAKFDVRRNRHFCIIGYTFQMCNDHVPSCNDPDNHVYVVVASLDLKVNPRITSIRAFGSCHRVYRLYGLS